MGPKPWTPIMLGAAWRSLALRRAMGSLALGKSVRLHAIAWPRGNIWAITRAAPKPWTPVIPGAAWRSLALRNSMGSSAHGGSARWPVASVDTRMSIRRAFRRGGGALMEYSAAKQPLSLSEDSRWALERCSHCTGRRAERHRADSSMLQQATYTRGGLLSFGWSWMRISVWHCGRSRPLYRQRLIACHSQLWHPFGDSEPEFCRVQHTAADTWMETVGKTPRQR